MIIFLYNLNYSYFLYANQPLSSFLSTNYQDPFYGNFNLLGVDANILRNVGIPILMSIILLVLKIIQIIALKYNISK